VGQIFLSKKAPKARPQMGGKVRSRRVNSASRYGRATVVHVEGPGTKKGGGARAKKIERMVGPEMFLVRRCGPTGGGRGRTMDSHHQVAGE